jgi:hypothetical protein
VGSLQLRTERGALWRERGLFGELSLTARSMTNLLERKQDEVAEQRSHQPREQQDDAIVCRCAPDPRIPKHLQQWVVAGHGRLVGEPNQSSC